MNKGYITPYDYCPRCGIKIYKRGEYYECHIHGDYDRDYVTGELKKVCRCDTCAYKRFKGIK